MVAREGTRCMDRSDFTHDWRLRKWLPGRYREPCRVLARGNGRGPRNVLIAFADGTRVVATRFSVRRLLE